MPVNEMLSEETLNDCHAFNDLFYCGVTGVGGVGRGGGRNNMSSTISMPSVAHSSLSGMRSGDTMSVGSFKGGSRGAGAWWVAVSWGKARIDDASLLLSLSSLLMDGISMMDLSLCGALVTVGGERCRSSRQCA